VCPIEHILGKHIIIYAYYYSTNQMTKITCIIFLILSILSVNSTDLQAQQLRGIVQDTEGKTISGATVSIDGTKLSTSTDSTGRFTLESTTNRPTLSIRAIGFLQFSERLDLRNKQDHTFTLLTADQSIDEVVVSGTLRAVSKLESPIPVEVYSSQFFRSNPTPTIFESLQTINGVRPQVNCSVCNTGDIHINGLEGPYTMVLIDGMPIVSGLSTVYGLNGIPQALIERVEIVKGPASTLYGSEAVGGLINIITKTPENAPLFSLETFGTTWQEYSLDLGGKFKVGSAQSLLGVNYFNYANPLDKNGDNFTDVTLQDRISIFNKWNFARKDNKTASLAGRYIYEDRWGGEMDWNRQYCGGDEVYGESIYTKRWELMGVYDLPGSEDLSFSFSANGHDQNSVYGDTKYTADQKILFG